MSQLKPEDLIFIDFEASGLGPLSWPIEIGLSWIEDGAARSWSSLIRPEEHWSMDAWSPASEKVHGIARADLDTAPSAREIVAETVRLTEGRLACSDAPLFDERWCARLFFGSPGVDTIQIAQVNTIIPALCDDGQLDRYHEKLARIPAPHRAGPDSVRYARALLHALSPLPEDMPRLR